MTLRTSAQKELDNITKCQLCRGVLNDHRILPCIHAFCLECLLNYGSDSQPGDHLPCPVCRKQFIIPDDGLSGMQKNFFVEKLLHARKLSAGEASGVYCEVCSSDEERPQEAQFASTYCFQCQQSYCSHCLRIHANITATSSHVTAEIGKQPQMKEIAMKLRATCDVHKGKEIELFYNNNNNNTLIYIAPACRMTSEALADSSSRATERQCFVWNVSWRSA